MTTITADTLSPITFKNIPVVTTELLAQLYGTDTLNIQVNHTRNKERFIEGKHYFKAIGNELKVLRLTLSKSQNWPQISSKTRALTLWTERGAARHAKMLETDQAWEVFERLEDCYFKIRSGSCIEHDDGPDNSKEVIHALISTPEHFITSLDGQLITSSLLVAEAFGKQHKHVLEKIESLDIPDSFSSANFSAHAQKIKAGAVIRDSKVYRMTKDGFMLLVMGFTGQRAMDIKIAYITAFNRMASQLSQQPAVTQLASGRITPEQQEAIKQLVLSRSKSVPPEHQPRAALTLWSALKNHFGRSYKEIDANQYSEALALVLQLRLVGDRPDARESVDNAMLLTDSNYRTQALDYIDDLLTRCNDYAEANGIDVTQWNPANYELAASGLLADLMRNIRAELSFDSHMKPVIKILPAEARYISPSSDESMRGLVSRVVSTETLMGMMSEGLARLDRERKAAK